MTNNSLDHKQRMIFVGLRRMTDDRNLIVDGFRHWMTSQSSDIFDIDSVVSDLVNYLGLGSAEKKSLILALHVAANKMVDDLPEVPASLLDRVSANDPRLDEANADIRVDSKKSVQQTLPPHCVVTAMYLQSFVQVLSKHDDEAFRELRGILKTECVEGVSKEIQQLIKKWAVDGLVSLALPNTVTESDCKSLAHHVYLLFTEIIGPMDSDNLVNLAIDRAKGIDEASRFSPTLLI